MAQVRGNFRAVADALIRAALEVSPLEEDDLERTTQIVFGSDIRKHPGLNALILEISHSHKSKAMLHGRRYALSILLHIQYKITIEL